MPPVLRSAARNGRVKMDALENVKVRVSQVITRSNDALVELLSACKCLHLCQAERRFSLCPAPPARRTRRREDAPAARAAVSIQGRAPQAETIGMQASTAPSGARPNKRHAQIQAASIRPNVRHRRSNVELRIPLPANPPALEQLRPSAHSGPSQSHTRSQPP